MFAPERKQVLGFFHPLFEPRRGLGGCRVEIFLIVVPALGQPFPVIRRLATALQTDLGNVDQVAPDAVPCVADDEVDRGASLEGDPASFHA